MILAVLVLLAAPRFETSTITASRTAIHPLETIDYTITVRNSGDSTASYLRVANAIPTSAMFVSASPDFKFIEADRELSWIGRVAPGQSKILTFSLITRPESSGLTLANRAAIHYDGSYRGIDHELEIAAAPTRGGMTNAGWIVVAYLAVGAGLFIITRRTRVAFGLIYLSAGFLLFFVDLARRDARMQSRFTETRCTIVDSMARYTESQRAGTTSSRRSGTWTPLFAVRYPTPLGDAVSIGYASASAVQFGSPRPSAIALAALPRGGTAPCWYDPDDPKQVVLVRGFGAAYGFALIPLMTLLLGVVLVRRALH